MFPELKGASMKHAVARIIDASLFAEKEVDD
jgi:hypothetical protein